MMRIPFASRRHDKPRLVPAPPPGIVTGQSSPKGTVRPPVVTTPQELPPPPVHVPDGPPGRVPPAPKWAVDRITVLTRELAAEKATVDALRKQLAQRPAPTGPGAGLRGMFRLAACENDKHLVDAIAADRAAVERANDRLRAENEQLRAKTAA